MTARKWYLTEQKIAAAIDAECLAWRNAVGRGTSPDAGVRDRVPSPSRPTTAAGDPAEGDDE